MDTAWLTKVRRWMVFGKPGLTPCCRNSVPLTPVVPLPVLPCWSHRAAVASGGAEIISQRSRGDNSCTWQPRMAGAWERPCKQMNLGRLFFPRTSKGELSAPGNRDPQRQGLAQGHSARQGRGLSPSSHMDGKIKRDNHYQQTLISSLPFGELILEIY